MIGRSPSPTVVPTLALWCTGERPRGGGVALHVSKGCGVTSWQFARHDQKAIGIMAAACVLEWAGANARRFHLWPYRSWETHRK